MTPSPLRVGSVPYLVARPLDAALADRPGLELVRDVPARLVTALRAGELDVALVSSVELFRRPGYAYLDGAAVVGHGRVSSVQVFLERPLAELRSVALDPASRSSAALACALLRERGLAPEWIEVGPDGDPRGAGADAWLRIGDRALRETFGADARPSFNPSEAWREATGLPFVFAAWIARPGVDLGRWAPVLERAREAGCERLDEWAAEASRRWRIPPEAARRYFHEECGYGRGASLAEPLAAFRDLLRRHGLAAPETPRRVAPSGSGVS